MRYSFRNLVHGFLLCAVLAVGAYFRFNGINWGDEQYQHPDERFLVWVTSDIEPVNTLGAYFNTEASTLNPANRGHRFFVYGTLPVFLVRYLADQIYDKPGWAEIVLVGRVSSAAFDWVTILLVILIGSNCFGRWVGLLAGFFSSAAVLQIQQAHFYTVDSFTTTFVTLALGMALRTAQARTQPADGGGTGQPGGWIGWLKSLMPEKILLRESLWFGLAVGMAMACKLNAAAAALLLPAALGIRFTKQGSAEQAEAWRWVSASLVVGGMAAFLAFRLFQPYAFRGPTFFDAVPDSSWVQSIREQRAQASGDVDFPPALQWADRDLLFSWRNLTVWGLGLPLGVAAWAGFLWMGWSLFFQIFKKAPGENSSKQPWQKPAPDALLIWGWTAFYFAWQSLAWNPTMRYQLPIYPTLALTAAWGVFSLGRLNEVLTATAGRTGHGRVRRWVAGVNFKGLAWAVGLVVGGMTAAWAAAFTGIYTRSETRHAASLWIYDQVPAAVNLEFSLSRQLLPLEPIFCLRQGEPYQVQFTAGSSGALYMLPLPQVRIVHANGAADELRLAAELVDLDQGKLIARSITWLPMTSETIPLEIVFGEPVRLQEGRRYGVEVSLMGGEASWVELSGQIKLGLYQQSAGAVGEIDPAGNSILFSYRNESGGLLHMVGLTNEIQGVMGPSDVFITLESSINRQQWTAVGRRVETGSQPAYLVDPPMAIQAGLTYQVKVELPGSGVGGVLDARPDLIVLDQLQTQSLPPFTQGLRNRTPLTFDFHPNQNNMLQSVRLWRASQQDFRSLPPVQVVVRLVDLAEPLAAVAEASASIGNSPVGDLRGSAVEFLFEPPVPLWVDHSYRLEMTVEGAGLVTIYGSAPANESDWDMGLPFRVGGYDGYGGLYQRDLNLQMYWEDNREKLDRFIDTLNQADVFFISSNRQWGTTVRVPDRYPLTTYFYRAMMGCPDEIDILTCYSRAEVGDWHGRLGFDLVEVFTSYPQLGPVEINTQFAEEAFTVYDHPKVFIFKKRADYDPKQVKALLSEVDLTWAAHITPRKAAAWSDLNLPQEQWSRQRDGGTWSELFPVDSLLNRSQVLAAVAWWGLISLLGWAVYPLVRVALNGLNDHGYAQSRMVGLLCAAFVVWIAGSAGIPVTRALILGITCAVVGLGLLAGWRQRNALLADLSNQRRYILGVEGLAVLLFAAFLWVRWGNPDLWHVIFGGEKPMDFSYFLATIKSSTYPPYDPWFAGGRMNYYYYGFLIAGTPVKLLGITPGVAYNLILPTWFSLTALGAFSIGSSLVMKRPWRGGILAAAAVGILGNQGTAWMLWDGWQRIGAVGQQIATARLGEKLAFTWKGFLDWLGGASLPYTAGEWYWIPSRAIIPAPGAEITEFPMFSFLYGDLHAHLTALPITILILAWAIGIVKAGGRWTSRSGTCCGLALGALAVGNLRSANSWDHPTYLVIALIAIGYAALRGENQVEAVGGRHKWLAAGGMMLIFTVLSLLAAAPFDAWFRQGYQQVNLWNGSPVNLTSYLVHWGLFLWILVVWLTSELIDWMAETPLSALKKLEPAVDLLIYAGLCVLGVWAGLLFLKIVIAWLVIPMSVLILALILRRGQAVEKKMILFLAGCGLSLTLLVEVFAVQGDRMNTVFKFYFQAWTMLALSSAAAATWLLEKGKAWGKRSRNWSFFIAVVLLGGAILTSFTSIYYKIKDRQSIHAPHTLDGAQFMAFTRLFDGPPGGEGREMDLSRDEQAIRWIQSHVPGSPVIIEAHTPEYRHWGNRFTIYTGLPGILGWENHQRQQRATLPGQWIDRRLMDIQTFYLSASREVVEAIIERYDIQYIIVGQLEKLYYPGLGLNKFHEWDGDAWERVYSDADTEVYKVK